MDLTRVGSGPANQSRLRRLSPQMVAEHAVFELASYVCLTKYSPMLADYPGAYEGSQASNFSYEDSDLVGWGTRVLKVKVGGYSLQAHNRKGKSLVRGRNGGPAEG